MAGSRTLKLSILADVDDLKKKLGTAENEVQGFAGKVEKFGAAAKAAFVAAAAAAGAYAVKLAVDGVKAAIEDEAAQKRLANALKNVTDATDTQIAAIEKQILKTSLATGVADDQLRPAFQRLAIATGDVTKSQDLLTLALDISAATGKDVETVSNALGKAYEGNTGSLTRLGVGLSAAEIKTLGLEGAVSQLASTFGGAAATQADTFQGKMARVQVAFDEAKETLGAALLPIIERFFVFITETAIPKMQEFKAVAIDPVIKAFKDNEQAIRGLFNFAKDFLVPFITYTLGNAIKGLSSVAGGIVKAVSIALRALEPIINAAITGINALIRAKNLLTSGPDTPTIGKVNFGSTGSTGSNTVASGSLPFGATLPTPPVISSSPIVSSPSSASGSSSAAGGGTVKVPTLSLIDTVTAANALKQIPAGNFDVGRFRQADNNINITVNGAVDPIGTARQIATILNSEASTAGTFSNLGVSRFATVAG
jgi:hypothetical protein